MTSGVGAPAAGGVEPLAAALRGGRLSRQQRRHVWLRWTVASTVGYAAAFAAAFAVRTLSLPPISFLLEGAVIGAAQWVLLRGALRRAWWWIAASALGMQLGLLLGYFLSPSGIGLVTGALIGAGLGLGVGQWALLRTRLRQAWWWIPASTVAIVAPTIAGGVFGQGALAGFFRTLVLSPLYGVLTATTLIWLLGQPARRTTSARPQIPSTRLDGSTDAAPDDGAPEARLQALYAERQSLRRRLDDLEQAIAQTEELVRERTKA